MTGLEERLVLSLARPSIRAAALDADVVSFRRTLGTDSLVVQGTSGADTVEIGRNGRGLVTLTVNGTTWSADPRDRSAFDRRLAGLRADRLRVVRLVGEDPADTIVLNTTLGSGRSAVSLKSQAVTIADAVATRGTLAIDAVSVTVAAPVRADAITLSASGLLNVTAEGSLTASKSIALKADRLVQTGELAAPAVTVQANVLIRSGTITATGGSVTVDFTENYVATEAAWIDVSATAGDGGTIRIDGGASGHLFNSGTLRATGAVTGGEIRMSGKDVVWIGGAADASGGASGGLIHAGGGWQGSDASMTKARTLQVSPHTTLTADGGTRGGTVVLWSEESTTNEATISAKGAAGGAVEVSSKLGLAHGGSVDVGPGGTFLLDPKNIVIADNPNGGVPQFELVNPTPNPGDNFGVSIVPLSTGNVVVTDPGDDAVATNAGAVYLFNGATGVLISTLTGSSASDQVGSTGVTALANGNFAMSNPYWNNGGISDAGAATWGSGTSGVSGVISASNSLVGTIVNDRIGMYGVVGLTNGNYVVLSQHWNDNAGAATWGNGTTGITGTVSASNSLIGASPNDYVGLLGTTALSNGNYVVYSPNWNGLRGAATWGNGTTGTVGTVSAANSLVGTLAGDFVGGDGGTALTNGNYVVNSYSWDNGAATNAGAVTLGNGIGGTVGAVSAANSLVGTKIDDFVGRYITALTNGNYVVNSYSWDNGAVVDAGAVTWGSGTTGVTGVVSATNSLVGSTSSDRVGYSGDFGRVTALSNGNYVVSSPNWDNGAIVNAGAVTWGNGTSGVSGVVSSSNSLVGSTASDIVGTSNSSGVSGVTALSNGNYVVSSFVWDNGSTVNVGAVTWGSGVSGISGAVSSSNSLIGTSWNDNVGSLGVKALSNGNYVVRSPNWKNGAATSAGAVTWGDGSAGIIGDVSSSNSLVGTTSSDRVGWTGVTALTNGNYVVISSDWANGSTAGVGAVTWGNGTSGISGAVSTSNSLVGSTASDILGSSGSFSDVKELSYGNYVINSPYWDNGATTNAGAVTWGNGTNGATLTGQIGGPVSATNSMVGAATLVISDPVNGTYLARTSASGGRVYVGLQQPLPGGVAFAANPASPANMSPAFVATPLSAGTATTLQANNDITLAEILTVNNPSGNGGALTLQAGRSISLNANITTDSGALTVLANASASDGVVNAQRDAGTGGITLATGRSINAGAAAVVLSAGPATGLTNRTSSGVTINGGIQAGSVTITTVDSGSGTPAVAVNGTLNLAGTLTIQSDGPVSFGASAAVTGMTNGSIVTSNDAVSFAAAFAQTGNLQISTGSALVSFADDWAIGSGAGMVMSTQSVAVADVLSLDGGTVVASSGLLIGASGTVRGSGLISSPISLLGASVTIAPGAGGLATGAGTLNFGQSLTLPSTSTVAMNGTSKTAFDKVIAGGVNLAGATLALDLSAATLSLGDSMTLVDNVSGSATSGAFAGLAQGALFTANGHTMQISYTGGDGNDVVVTKVSDITASFSVNRSGFMYVDASDSYWQLLTLTNTSLTAKKPRTLKFVGLPDRVSVVGGTKIGPDWFLNVGEPSVSPTGSVGLPVYFQVASGGAFAYALEVIGG